MIKQYIKKMIPARILAVWNKWHFDESRIIYKGVSYKDFLDSSIKSSRPNISEEEKRGLFKDIKKVYLADGTRPDEYLLYRYYDLSLDERKRYMPRKLKDKLLLDYYGKDARRILGQLRDKYEFYLLSKPYFKRGVIKVKDDSDWIIFNSFCKEHSRFICKIVNGGCGVGVRIEDVTNPAHVKELFEELINQGSWIVEELIRQDESISMFNRSSVNTIRFPSFKHGNTIVQDYPCIRFGRAGNIVDNAGQGGVFASIDISSGVIITNGFDELGHEYEAHPDSKVIFKGFKIPKWKELLEEARIAHMALPAEQTYVAFDYALSNKGWAIVEGNWGDFVLQQTSLRRGLKYEFVKMLEGKQ